MKIVRLLKNIQGLIENEITYETKFVIMQIIEHLSVKEFEQFYDEIYVTFELLEMQKEFEILKILKQYLGE